jgi:hypothetical protein
MLRLLGVRVVPSGALAFLVLAIVLLVVGWLVHLIAAATGWSSLLPFEIALLGTGAFCGIWAGVRAARAP